MAMSGSSGVVFREISTIASASHKGPRPENLPATLLWDYHASGLKTHPPLSLPAHVLTTGKHLFFSSKPDIRQNHLLSPHPTAAAPQILLALGSFAPKLPKQALGEAVGVRLYN